MTGVPAGTGGGGRAAGNRGPAGSVQPGVDPETPPAPPLAADPDRPFRGSVARTAGRATRAQLAGPAYVRLFPDTYVPAHVPVDLAVRAAGLLVWQPDGVLAGLGAAALWGAWPDEVWTLELVVGRSGGRAPRRVRVRQDRLPVDEVAVRDGLRLTTPCRTAYDVGRDLPFVEAVVVIDALGRDHGVSTADVLGLAAAHRHERGLRRLRDLLEHVDPRARSATATRVRLGLAGRTGIGVPVPSPLLAEHGRPLGTPDLAWPDEALALFCGGDAERVAWEALQLALAGWSVLRLAADQVAAGSASYAPEVARALHGARGQASSARTVSIVSASAAVLSSR